MSKAKLTVAEAERILGPEKTAAIMTGDPPPQAVPEPSPAPPKPPPACPRHPDQPQVQITRPGKRQGEFMGRCKICLKAIAQQNRHADRRPPAAEVPVLRPVLVDFSAHPDLAVGLQKLCHRDLREPANEILHLIRYAMPSALTAAASCCAWMRYFAEADPPPAAKPAISRVAIGQTPPAFTGSRED